ncbi:MAG TPA: hypothetical protein VLA34_09810, partial [Candidatus Krumholzibacterium sp.]|nr:hypothetical protein [Candidatus Krumholzibacterium sp.]
DDYEDETSFEFVGIRAENAGFLIAHGIDIKVYSRLSGLAASGISIRAKEIAGAAVAGICVKAEEMRGFSAGCVNYFEDYQQGLAIGLFNFAEELSGIQIGLINIARNNPSGARVLPIINAHFD